MPLIETKKNILLFRDHYKETMETIKGIFEKIQTFEECPTHLKGAVNYFLNNYKAHTLFLEEPLAQLTNNSAERALRVIRLQQNGSMFQKTLTGSFIQDILFTISATASAAEVNLFDYLIWVLKTPESDIEANPENYTPLAYSKSQESSSS